LFQMDRSAKRGSHYTGSRDFFTIKAPLVSVEDCEASWAKDEGEGDASSLREASGLGALVTYRSKSVLKRAAEICDTYLLRELDYARQYERHDNDREHIAYLWADPTTLDDAGRLAVFGACCFRNRHYTDYEHPYAMQWVWLHPYARRHGHLLTAWPYFEKRFGLFNVEGPYSDAMLRFLVLRTRYNELRAKLGLESLTVLTRLSNRTTR
jgi:hypothetical protein